MREVTSGGGRRNDGVFLFVVAAICCLAGTCVATATGRGALLSHDSIAYFAAARSVIAGQGLTIPFGSAEPTPLTYWPPLYPLVLAAAGLLTKDVERGAIWLSIGLLAGATVLMAILARRLTKSGYLGCAAAFVFASLLTTWQTYSMVMAEPLFVFLLLLFVYLLDQYFTGANRWLFFAAAAAAGLALITRFAGLPFIGWGAIVIFQRGRSSWRRWSDAVLWTLAASTPAMLVAVWHLRVAGSVAHRTLAWHPQSIGFFLQLLNGCAGWILPAWLPHRVWVLAAVCLPLAPVAGMYFLRRPRAWESSLALLIVINIAFLVAVGFLADAIVGAKRAAQGMVAFEILLVVIAGSRFLRTPRTRRAVAAAVVALILIPNCSSAYRWVRDRSLNTDGFGGSAYRESDTMAFVRALPAKAIIYTNLPEPIYIATGRNARFLPLVEDAQSRRRMSAEEIAADIHEIALGARSGDAVAVYFRDDGDRQPIMVKASELSERSGLTRARVFRDATVYTSGW